MAPYTRRDILFHAIAQFPRNGHNGDQYNQKPNGKALPGILSNASLPNRFRVFDMGEWSGTVSLGIMLRNLRRDSESEHLRERPRSDSIPSMNPTSSIRK